MKAMHLTGHCNCGGVSYTYDGTPDAVGYCHCKQCQRQSGGTGSLFIYITDGDLKITSKTLSRTVTKADSGYNVNRFFCGSCGSPIVSRCESLPGKAFIKAGTLDDTSMLNPSLEVWCVEAQPWVAKIPDAVRHPKGP